MQNENNKNLDGKPVNQPLGDDSIDSLTISPDIENQVSDDDFSEDSVNSEEDDYSTEDIRVANLKDDADEIEADQPNIDALDDNEFEEDDELELVRVNNGEQLSSSEALNIVLRRNASLILETRAKRKEKIFLIIVAVLLTILCFIFIYAFTLYPKVVYIPTKDNAAVCEVQPEDNPYLTDLSISEFGRDGILSLYNINYTNWQSQTDKVFSEYFTQDGKARTIEALKTSGLINYVDSNALSLVASSTSASHVESRGAFPNGDPYWMVRFPFVVEVYSGSKERPIQIRRYVATVRVVVDRSSAVNVKGLGIDAVTLYQPKD